MELDNFELVKFNQFNIEHEYIIKSVFDVRGSRYLSSYENFMDFFSKCSDDVMFVLVLCCFKNLVKRYLKNIHLLIDYT